MNKLNLGSVQIPINAAKRPAGWKHTEEARAKIRAKRALQVITPETREKIRVAHTGLKHTVDELRKMSDSQKGRIIPQQVREKMSEWQIGERNNRWRGGITQFRKKLRNLGKYCNWRDEIIQRDGGCKDCGSRENIEVDHAPLTLKDILLKYSIDTVEKALACDALWDTNNGQVLCAMHHKEKTYV